jgi:hypothetical protein
MFTIGYCLRVRYHGVVSTLSSAVDFPRATSRRCSDGLEQGL